jgi:Skp family chaperone for outer membrane proteins
MKISQVSAAVLVAAVVSALGSAASAQSPGAPPTGPVLPGICVLSKDRMILGSAVGKYVLNRLDQLSAQASAELTSEQSAIQNDAKTLQGQQASLPAEQFQQRGALLNQREGALQRKYQLIQRELSATHDKALAHIGAEVDPIVRQVFVQRGCSLLLDGAALIYPPAPGMDVTEAVVHGLDAKIQQFPFDREQISEGAQAQ